MIKTSHKVMTPVLFTERLTSLLEQTKACPAKQADRVKWICSKLNGVSAVTVRRWLNGSQIPHQRKTRQLALLLKAKMDYLLVPDYEGEMFISELEAARLQSAPKPSMKYLASTLNKISFIANLTHCDINEIYETDIINRIAELLEGHAAATDAHEPDDIVLEKLLDLAIEAILLGKSQANK